MPDILDRPSIQFSTAYLKKTPSSWFADVASRRFWLRLAAIVLYRQNAAMTPADRPSSCLMTFLPKQDVWLKGHLEFWRVGDNNFKLLLLFFLQMVHAFRCLLYSSGYLHYSHQPSMDIIYACFTLHNFLISKKYPVESDLDELINEELPNGEVSHNILRQNVSARWNFLN